MTGSEISRQELRDFLEGELNRIENLESPPQNYMAMQRLVFAAIDALDALDWGEVRPVFQAVDTTTQGTKPFLLHQAQIIAVQHVAVLRKKFKYSAVEANHAVALAYGLGDESIKKWWTVFGKSGKSGEIKVAIKIFSSGQALGFAPSLERRLTKIAKDGKAYQSAKMPATGN